MPKKFGTNTKAQEANMRKSDVKKEKQQKELKAKEDALWEDKDKSVLEKEKKKKALEDKKAAEAQRKAQNRELLEKETAELSSKGKTQPAATKVTRAEIEKRKEIENFANKKREEKEKKQQEEEIEVNINRVIAEEKAKAGDKYLEARSVVDAIDKLDVDGEGSSKDRHPEKRLKAAYLSYETNRLPSLREENPSLKLSQLKDLLWKEWQKAPENPLNQ